MKLPFGKYRGLDVGDLPTAYLRWLTTIELEYPLSAEVADEVLARQRARKSASRRQTALVPPSVADRWRRKMATLFHPDHGGRTRDMQVVNEGHRLLCEMTEGATR